MKKELKLGIEVADKLIEEFENGNVNFVELTCGLWNEGYKACKEDLALPIHGVINWVDVSKQLPTKNKPVLIYEKHLGVRAVTFLSKDNKYWINSKYEESKRAEIKKPTRL